MLLLVQVRWNMFYTIQTPISNVRTKEYNNSELISRLNLSPQKSSMKWGSTLPTFPVLPLQVTRMVTKLKKICSRIASGDFFTLTVS